MTKGLTACPPPLSQRCRWPPQGWVSPTVILVDTQVWKLLAWIWTQCIEMMEPGWKKSFIQLPILCVNSQAVAFSVLWGRRSYFCVGQSTLYFPQSWELMRFVSLLHYNTSDSPFLRLSWLLITPGQRTGVVPPILLRRGHNVPVWSTHANFHHLEKLYKGRLPILLSVFSILSLL